MDNIIPRSNLGQIFRLEKKEIWSYNKPEMGDHIRVSRGLYSHHGIYISEDEIIHFTGAENDNILDWSKNEVIQSHLDEFLRGGTLEVKEYTEDELDNLYPVEHIVHYARICLGDAGYNLIINNCEHFANMCTLGRFRSRQVENVFGRDIFRKRGWGTMGLFGRIADGWNAFLGKGKTSTGGRTSTTNTYNYEPDKVKIEEIEADLKLKLADKENQRIEFMKNAYLDMLEFEYKSNLALEEAKVRGLTYMVQTIITMQEKLNEVAEARFKIIESCSLQNIREIESFYSTMGDKIAADNDIYNSEKLPKLISICREYEGTPAYAIYSKRIDQDMSLHLEHQTKQMGSLTRRQEQVLESYLKSKETILNQTGEFTVEILKNLKSESKGIKALEEDIIRQPSLDERQNIMLNPGE